MGRNDVYAICVSLSLITLGVAGSLTVFGATGDIASYPYEPVATVEAVDILAVEPIEVQSETLKAVVVDETIPFAPLTEPETEFVMGAQPIIEETAILETEPPEPEREVYLTDRERQLMAQLVHSEAGTEGYDVKCYVVDVVFNRVDSPKFPNTIEEVIFQRRQFSVIRNGSFDRAANELEEDDWLAVDEECYGRRDYGILYFNSDSIGGCANGKGGWKTGHTWFAY